jgi:ABC-2 type transport system ATP-binding protein
VAVEVASRNGPLEPAEVQRRLEQVPGVSRVVFKETRQNRQRFEVESLQGRAIRGELARSIVEAGWDLYELHGTALSLEEIFLQLTASEDGGVRGGTQ